MGRVDGGVDGAAARAAGPVRPPASVRLVGAGVGALAGLLALTAVLTKVRHDDLVLAWAGADDTAGPLVAAGGLDALEESAIAVPAFLPVAVATFVVFGAVAGVLLAFLRQGAPWARRGLTATVLFFAAFGALGLRTDPPGVFAAVLVASLFVDVALLVLLAHRDTSAFVARRGRGAGVA